MERSLFPNKRKNEDLHENILKYMSEVQGFRLGEIIRFVTGNMPSPSLAMYHTLEQKLKRYYADMRVKGKISALESYAQRSTQSSQTYQVCIMKILASCVITLSGGSKGSVKGLVPPLIGKL